MNLKRDAQGVVDGIVAEDIGKFPDTNLAESLQRISGVSIDRSIGEGSQITVRGVGPDFNLVLLNGRQMPASSIGDTRRLELARVRLRQPRLRSDFARSRSTRPAARKHPTGGIGATINIKTARPLDKPGLRANFGVKGVIRHVGGQPARQSLQGDSITPEISGIFSNTFADGKFGVALSASYQERDFGFSQAAVANGWRPFARRREQLGHDSAAGHARLARTSPIAPRPTTSIRCRRTSATASTACSASAPTAS